MEQNWEKWTPENVVEWLISKKLGHLAESFYKIKVTGEHLARMDDSFLKTYLNVSSSSERNTILESISHLPNIGDKNFVHSTPTSPGKKLYVEISGKRPPPKPKTDLEAQTLINSPDNLHSGWIIKQGGRIRTWRRRYMVLHTGCLYYFENEKSQKQKGSLSLPGYVLTEYSELKDYPNCCIKLAHKNPNKRVYYICTSSQREKEKWIESIQKEIDLYKEENLLGQAIYGAMAEPNCNGKSQNITEALSDEDNDDDDVSPVSMTFPRNLTQKTVPDQHRFYTAKLSKPDHSGAQMSDHGKIVHANTMKPKITLTNSSSYEFSHSSPILSPSPQSNLSFPAQATLSPEPPTSPRCAAPPDLTEDQYLVIFHGNPAPANGLAQRELPSVPERLPHASIRPLPTVPVHPFPSSLSFESLPNPERRISAPSLTNTSRHSLSDLVKPLPNKPTELKSYVDVEGDIEDFSQLSNTFANTLNAVSTPPAHPLPSPYDVMECNEDDGDAYIAPVMEVLPEACIQSGFTREKAESVLTSVNLDGMYLIRSSSEENISMVLTVWCKDKCKHYKIFKLEKGYCLHRGSYFSSLEELIRQYRVSTLPRSNYTLKVPYNIKHT